jgi:hypothetical protein
MCSWCVERKAAKEYSSKESDEVSGILTGFVGQREGESIKRREENFVCVTVSRRARNVI